MRVSALADFAVSRPATSVRAWHPALGPSWREALSDLDGGPSSELVLDPDTQGVGLRLAGSVCFVRCPICSGLDDKVVDSRLADDGSAIRRRRECTGCGSRFTTFERLEEQVFTVVKRSGDRVPFDRAKIEAGLAAAAKGRPVTEEQMRDLSLEVEEELQLSGPEVQSEVVGLAVLDRLRGLDEVAYLRFASVYKDFSEASDFERELQVLTKQTEPKRH